MINKKTASAELDRELSNTLRDRVNYANPIQQPSQGGTQVASKSKWLVDLFTNGLADFKAKARPDIRTKDVLEGAVKDPDAPELSTEELQQMLRDVDPNEGADIPMEGQGSTGGPLDSEGLPTEQMLDSEGLPTEQMPDAEEIINQSLERQEQNAQPEPPTVEEMDQQGAEPSITPEDSERLLNEYIDEPVPDQVTEKRTDERNINIQRASEGGIANTALDDMNPDDAIALMETTDDINKLLTVFGRNQPDKGVRTFDEIESRNSDIGKIKNELQDIFKGDPKTVGALTDVQLFGLRRVLSTLAEETSGLANKISKGDESAETLLEWQKKSESFNTLYNFVSGRVTEAARALSQQRMIAKTLRKKDGSQVDITALSDMLNGGGGYVNQDHMVVAAKNMARKMEKRGMSAEEVAVENAKPRTRDYAAALMEYFTHNLITGVETYAVNGIGSAISASYQQLLVKPTAWAIGAATKTAGMNRVDRVTNEEMMANLASATVGMYDGIFAFANELKGVTTQFGASKTEAVEGSMQKIFGHHFGDGGRAVASGLTMGFKVLSGTDAFYKTSIFRSELTGLAVRDAYAKGIKDVNGHIDNVLNNPNNFDELVNEAMDTAKTYTFTDSDRAGFLGLLSRSAKMLIREHPSLKLIAPFVDTPINLLHYAVENSPAGMLTQRLRDDFAAGGAKRDMALAKITVGTATWAGVYALFASDKISGGTSWPDQMLIEQMGGKTETLFIDGSYYTIDRLDPLAMSVFGLVTGLEQASRAKTEQEYAEIVGAAIVGIAGQALDATFMSGMSDFLKVLQGDKKFSDWAANSATGFVSYSGAVRSVKKFVDPQPRDAAAKGFGNKVTNRLKSMFPWLSDDLPPRRYWDGTPVLPKNGKPVLLMTLWDKLEEVASPVKTSTPPKVTDKATLSLLQNGINPPRVSDNVKIGSGQGSVGFSLLDLDDNGKIFDLYEQTVGEFRRRAVESAMQEDGFAELEAGYGSPKQAALSKALSKGTRLGKDQFFGKVLKEYISQDIDSMSKFTQLVGLNPEQFAELARAADTTKESNPKASETYMPSNILKNLEIKGKSDKGELPPPLHLRKEQPRF